MIDTLIRVTNTDVVEDKIKIKKGDIIEIYEGETITEAVSNSNFRKMVISDGVKASCTFCKPTDTLKRRYYILSKHTQYQQV